MIHLVAALPCEAAPVVDRFEMSRRMQQTEFTVYQKDEITLTVSGVGKSAMAAAVTYTFMLYAGERNHVWLNFGVAGHALHEPGRVVLVDRITEFERGFRWYPPLLECADIFTGSLITVGRPETGYEGQSLYDMEASAFYETATRYSTAELVQVLKVVSDNRRSQSVKLDPGFVSQLIVQAIPRIESQIGRLQKLRNFIPQADTEIFDRFANTWHFTAQQKILLSTLLRRWQALVPDTKLDPTRAADLKSAKQVLAWLQRTLENQPVRLQDDA